MTQKREFMYKVGEASLYRFKDRMMTHRLVLVDGVKELLFDNEKELRAYLAKRSLTPGSNELII